MSDEIDFLHADKHESLLQIDTMTLIGIVKHSQSSQNSKFTMSLQYLKKEVRDEVDFWHVDKHQSFLQVDFNTLGMKDAYKVILSLLLSVIKHFQSTQCNKFAISLREFFFCMQMNIQVSTSWDYCSWWKWPDMSKVSKIGSCSYFCVLLWCKTFRYFIGVRPCLYLFSRTARLDFFCLKISI